MSNDRERDAHAEIEGAIRRALGDAVVEVGPPMKWDDLRKWVLERHVDVCDKAGVNCKACRTATELGVAARGAEA